MTTTVEPHEIRAQLQRLRTAEPFASSPQLVSFLDYVVEETLAGRARDLKGYTIAVEALGRPTDFDPQNDPIVRVEARRLRQAIKFYYDGPGRDDPVVIDIPLGGYVPLFQRRDAEGPAGAPEAEGRPRPEEEPAAPQSLAAVQEGVGPPASPSQPATRRLKLFALVGCFAALAAAVTIAAWLGQSGPALTGRAMTGHGADAREVRLPVIRAPTFEAAGASDPPRDMARRLGERLVLALSRFDEVRVFGPAAPPASDPASEYLLRGRLLRRADGTFSLGVALLSPETRAILMSREFPDFQPEEAKAPSVGPHTEAAVLRGIAIDISQAHGVISADQLQRLARDRSDEGACLFAAQTYWRAPTRERHKEARDCLTGALAGVQPASLVQAHLAFLALDEYRLDYNPLPGAALDRALAHARAAVDAAPTSARAQQALMDSLFLRGEIDQALRAGERAITLNPYDMEIVADYGARLIQSGREIRGGRQKLLEAAVAMAVRSPWIDFYLVVSAMLVGDRNAALSHAHAIVSDSDALSLIARILAAKEESDLAKAEALARKLVALDARYRTNPRDLLARRSIAPRILDWLVANLAAVTDRLPS